MEISKTVQRQHQFAQAVALLIQKAECMGFFITLGDAYRDPRCPYGAKNSKHRKRLAIDLNLFDADGTYLTKTDDHKALGSYWERSGGIWGGHVNDGNHYEWPLTD